MTNIIPTIKKQSTYVVLHYMYENKSKTKKCADMNF